MKTKQRLRYWTTYHLNEGYFDDRGVHHLCADRREAEYQAWRTMRDEDAYNERSRQTVEAYDEDFGSDVLGRL